MAVPALDIQIYHGDDVTVELAVPVAVTAASLHIKPYFGNGEVLVETGRALSLQIDVDAGTLTLAFDSAFSTTANWRVAEYEIRATVDGKTTTLYEGEIRIVQHATANHGQGISTSGNGGGVSGLGDLSAVTQAEADSDFNSI